MTTLTAARPASRDMAVRAAPKPEAAARQVSAEDVQAMIEARCQAALEEALAGMTQEIAEPYPWWNLWAIGPIQPIAAGGPLLPHQVIKVGEPAFVATIVALNPAPILPGPTSPGDVLSNFGLPGEVQYATGNLTTWSLGPASLQHLSGFNLLPGVYFYVNVFGFVATNPGLYEMNITARLLGATPPAISAPQFAGFARAVVDIDPDLFIAPAPGMQFDHSIRFQVYP